MTNAVSKIDRRKVALELRAAGLSINDIVLRVGAAKSTVSTWVRSVVLTEAQRQKLWEQNPSSMHNVAARERANTARSATCRLKRVASQEVGAKLARQRDPDFIAGCMLYWAEGAKSKNQLIITNTDGELLHCFIRFLRKYFNVEASDIRLTISCYSASKVTSAQAEEYWLTLLTLPGTCLYPTRVDADKRGVYARKLKYPYGMCRITVNNTDLVQQIFGAIREYAHIEELRWI